VGHLFGYKGIIIMQTVLKNQLEVGKVYRFKYHGETRVVLLEEFQEGRDYTENILCWDFTKDGYRSFNEGAIYGELQDVTDYAVINHTERTYSKKNVHTHMFNDKQYAVAW
jgi:hypothetical protein